MSCATAERSEEQRTLLSRTRALEQGAEDLSLHNAKLVVGVGWIGEELRGLSQGPLDGNAEAVSGLVTGVDNLQSMRGFDDDVGPKDDDGSGSGGDEMESEGRWGCKGR